MLAAASWTLLAALAMLSSSSAATGLLLGRFRLAAKCKACAVGPSTAKQRAEPPPRAAASRRRRRASAHDGPPGRRRDGPRIAAGALGAPRRARLRNRLRGQVAE